MIDIERARTVARLHLDNGIVVSEEDAKLICQALLAGGPLAAIRRKSAQMAEDEGLWFKAETCAEAYVQQELRKLCAFIEALTPEQEGVDAARDGAVGSASDRVATFSSDEQALEDVRTVIRKRQGQPLSPSYSDLVKALEAIRDDKTASYGVSNIARSALRSHRGEK